jgi:hypothetical protein
VWLTNGTYWKFRENPGFANTNNLELWWRNALGPFGGLRESNDKMTQVCIETQRIRGGNWWRLGWTVLRSPPSIITILYALPRQRKLPGKSGNYLNPLNSQQWTVKLKIVPRIPWKCSITWEG